VSEPTAASPTGRRHGGKVAGGKAKRRADRKPRRRASGGAIDGNGELGRDYFEARRREIGNPAVASDAAIGDDRELERGYYKKKLEERGEPEIAAAAYEDGSQAVAEAMKRQAARASSDDRAAGGRTGSRKNRK